jgi:hypothetical protein
MSVVKTTRQNFLSRLGDVDRAARMTRLLSLENPATPALAYFPSKTTAPSITGV